MTKFNNIKNLAKLFKLAKANLLLAQVEENIPLFEQADKIYMEAKHALQTAEAKKTRIILVSTTNDDTFNFFENEEIFYSNFEEGHLEVVSFKTGDIYISSSAECRKVDEGVSTIKTKNSLLVAIDL